MPGIELFAGFFPVLPLIIASLIFLKTVILVSVANLDTLAKTKMIPMAEDNSKKLFFAKNLRLSFKFFTLITVDFPNSSLVRSLSKKVATRCLTWF